MAVPRANPGGMYGSGVFPQAPHQIDVSGAINAIAGGASSLIHGAYLRKMGQMNYALQLRRLEQEGEMHKAQLEALTAYRTAALGNASARIAAPDARKTKANGQAFTDLQKEFPAHPLVAPDDAGQAAAFDPENQQDYVGALKAARGQKAASDKELAVHADRLDTLEKSGALRAQLQKSGIILRAGANATKPLTPAQQQTRDAKDKETLLKQIGDLSGGDPTKAQALIDNDPDVAAAASRLKVGAFEIRAAATAAGNKNAGSTSTTTFTPTGQTTTRSKTPAPLVTPRSPAAATAPNQPLPPPTPGQVPQTPAPLATPGTPTSGAVPAATAPKIAPLVAPPVSGAVRTPLPSTPAANAATAPALVPGTPAAPVKTPLAKAPDESTLGHHDLWNLKVQQGMKPDEATAYVLKAKGPQVAPAAAAPAPAVVVPKPDEDDEGM